MTNSRLARDNPIHVYDNINFIYVNPTDGSMWSCDGLPTQLRRMKSSPIDHVHVELSFPSQEIAGGAPALYVPVTNVMGHVIDSNGGVGHTAFTSMDIKSQVIGGGKRVFDETDHVWPEYAILIKNNWVWRDRPLTRSDMIKMGIGNTDFAVPAGFVMNFNRSGDPYMELVDLEAFKESMDEDGGDSIGDGDVFVN